MSASPTTDAPNIAALQVRSRILVELEAIAEFRQLRDSDYRIRKLFDELALIEKHEGAEAAVRQLETSMQLMGMDWRRLGLGPGGVRATLLQVPYSIVILPMKGICLYQHVTSEHDVRLIATYPHEELHECLGRLQKLLGTSESVRINRAAPASGWSLKKLLFGS